MKILMVCHGNICRSPLAEGILQHKAKMAGLMWKVESAGMSNYHAGDQPIIFHKKLPKSTELISASNVQDSLRKKIC